MGERQHVSGDGTLTVREYSGPDDEWDELVARTGGGTFCHLAGWRRVMTEVLPHDMVRLVAVDVRGTCAGVLPLVHVRSRLFGNFLLSMPFLSYGGPTGTDDAKQLLAEAAIAEAERRGVDLLELRSRERVPGSVAVSTRKLIVTKQLSTSPEEAWERDIRAKLRSQVRRPMKEGMTTRFGLELVDAFYDVFARTMRDLGTPVLPKTFFRAVAESFPSQLVVGVVEYRGRAVAAGCGFDWGGEVEITWAGALREHAKSAPNMLLYWEFMVETIRRGNRRFNFGRCSPGSGTHRFKMQWGGEEQPLPWAQWSARGLESTPSPQGTKFKLATSVWRRLPLFVTNAVGPFVSPFLP